MTDRDDSLARVVETLREPVRLSPELPGRVMAEIARLPAPGPTHRKPALDRARPRWTIRLSPARAVGLAAGLAVLALALGRQWPSYAAYLVSTDQTEIQRLYDRAVSNDHRAQASLITGEALIATGLYLRFIRRPGPKRASFLLGPSRCALSYRF